MNSLFTQLKFATEQEHKEMESIIDPMKNFSSVDAYKAHLLKSWLLYESLEAGLAGFDWSALAIDFGLRRKLPLIEADLRFLQVPLPAKPSEQSSPEPGDMDSALGRMYVMEGATLGGQFISRHLATLRIGPSNGGLFFNGYGAKTGEMWKSFQTSASQYCVSEDQIARAVSAAKTTFGIFREAMLGRELTPVTVYGS